MRRRKLKRRSFAWWARESKSSEMQSRRRQQHNCLHGHPICAHQFIMNQETFVQNLYQCLGRVPSAPSVAFVENVCSIPEPPELLKFGSNMCNRCMSAFSKITFRTTVLLLAYIETNLMLLLTSSKIMFSMLLLQSVPGGSFSDAVLMLPTARFQHTLALPLKQCVHKV